MIRTARTIPGTQSAAGGTFLLNPSIRERTPGFFALAGPYKMAIMARSTYAAVKRRERVAVPPRNGDCSKAAIRRANSPINPEVPGNRGWRIRQGIIGKPRRGKPISIRPSPRYRLFRTNGQRRKPGGKAGWGSDHGTSSGKSLPEPPRGSQSPGPAGSAPYGKVSRRPKPSAILPGEGPAGCHKTD